MLETVMRWHSDQNIFNRECANYPGFVTKFRVSNQFSEANDHVGYENYRHVCHKWHYKITKAIVFCLDSKEYMQIRNALIILMRILPHYPVLNKLAQIIERKVEKVREEEKNKRPDLFVIASSYIGQLKTKANQMIKETDFHQVTERPAKGTTGATTLSTNAVGTTTIPSSTGNQADVSSGAALRVGMGSTSTSTSTGTSATSSLFATTTIASTTLSSTVAASHSTAISAVSATSLTQRSSSSSSSGNVAMANNAIFVGGSGSNGGSSTPGGIGNSLVNDSCVTNSSTSNNISSSSSQFHSNSNGGSSTKQISNGDLKIGELHIYL